MFFEGHCHTLESDGYRTPDELLEEAYNAGIRGLLITDHNIFTYETPFYYNDMLVLPAAELSTVYKIPGTGEKKEIHVITVFGTTVPEAVKSILPDPDQSAYHSAILAKLAELGINISLEEVYKMQSKCRHFGRPQIADYLTTKGFARSREDAMDRLIGNYSPHYINPVDYLDYPALETAAETVLKSGGIPILAHPYAYMLGDKIPELIRYYASLAEPWRMGVEVYYSKYELKQTLGLEKLADENALLKSAGSDSHRKEQPLWRGDYTLFETIRNKLTEIKDRKGEGKNDEQG